MTQTFAAQGLRLAYDDVGDGEPIVLLHGFAADRRLNWKLTGWYEALVGAGYRLPLYLGLQAALAGDGIEIGNSGHYIIYVDRCIRSR